MDPLSVTASIIAVLQLSAEVLRYLSDVKDAPKDRAKCGVEAANAHSLLMNLRFRLEDGSADTLWYTAVRALGVENGPLDQFKQALEELQNGLTDKGRLQRAGKALVWKFKKGDITSILARIERLKTLVGIALEMDHFKLSQAIKDDTDFIRTDVSATRSQVDSIWQEQADEKHKSLVEWISHTNYPAQQADIIARRQERTGQWFLDAPEVTGWINKPKGTLFCPGIPGAGKTVVASITIDFLLNSVQSSLVGVAYIYCNYKAKEEQNASSMLAAILKQLVQSRPSVVAPVARLHKQHEKRGTKPSLDELSVTLQEVAADFSTVYIVIDALDECQDSDGNRHQLLTRLRDVQAKRDIRLMVTSRFIPEIEEKFKESEKLEIRASDEDVRRFVSGQIVRLPKCIQRDSALQQLVEETIPERVDGMFLLARLHVDSLLDKTTAKKVKKTLDNLSKGSAALDNAYNDALERIQGQLEGQYELARKILSWITYAKRPLTIAELCCALAVEPEDAELDPDNLPDPEDLLSVCAGLVIVDQESAVVRLVHYTTQEYFERTMDKWYPRALLEITSTCLTYLSFDTFRTGASPSDREFEKRLEENEFLEYAAKHWGEHARMVQHEAAPLIVSFLRNSELISCAVQVSMVSTWWFRGYSQRYPKCFTGLHLAAQFGLSSIIEEILAYDEQEIGAPLEVEDDFGCSILNLAARYGHYETMETLLEKIAVTDIRTVADAALIEASYNGHKAIVELLLEKGVEVDMKGGVTTALIEASVSGHEAIVELLLEKGAGVDTMGGVTTALIEASYNGHKAIVELLLEKGVKVDTKGDITIALVDASRDGHKAIVELLLEKGAEPTDMALQFAAGGGYDSIVKLLLEEGAEANGRALYAAICGGYESIVKLLLEKAVGINVIGAHHRLTTFEAASHWGREKDLKLLLAVVANIAARDGFDSVLEIALKRGHEGVAKILRDAGAC